MIATYLWLAKVYLRVDQPKAAIDIYMRGVEQYPGETSLMVRNHHLA